MFDLGFQCILIFVSVRNTIRAEEIIEIGIAFSGKNILNLMISSQLIKSSFRIA